MPWFDLVSSVVVVCVQCGRKQWYRRVGIYVYPCASIHIKLLLKSKKEINR